MNEASYTGENRCWACTIANGAVGLLVALVPLLAALIEGSTVLVVGATVWAVAVMAVTVYRLLVLGYLPFAEPVAKATGLHDRIGPGSDSEPEQQNDR